MGLCCGLSSGFVIFYDDLRWLGGPLGLGNNTVFQISLLAFIGSPSYHCQATKTACVQRRRPLPLITHLLSTSWHTRGWWSAGWRKVAQGWRRPHYQPAGQPSGPLIPPPTVIPPAHTLLPPLTLLLSELLSLIRIILCCLVPISEQKKTFVQSGGREIQATSAESRIKCYKLLITWQ